MLPRESGRKPSTELQKSPLFITLVKKKEPPVKELRVLTQETDPGVIVDLKTVALCTEEITKMLRIIKQTIKAKTKHTMLRAYIKSCLAQQYL